MQLDPSFAFQLQRNVREVRPASVEHLLGWTDNFLDLHVSSVAVCDGHSAPSEAFSQQVLTRPPMALWIASRGGGKSYLSSVDTHITSRFSPHHETRILGGSKAQSEQIYRALKTVVENRTGDADSIKSLLAQSAHYVNGSEVSILAASPRAVRGPHVPSLKLDEVDEIDSDIREAAMGMAMDDAKRGYKTSVLMTSTWHRPGGPVTELVERGNAGEFPVHTWCVFEVLERCPESRSGPWVGGDEGYLNCPQCPIVQHCHAGRLNRQDQQPKAKRSNGHYSISSLVQKAKGVSKRTFESDYLCKGPKTEGLFFPSFDPAVNVSTKAEWDASHPVYFAIDPGLRCASVWFQILESRDSDGTTDHEVRVFADYYKDGSTHFANAVDVLNISRDRCQGRRDKSYADPAGKARSGFGVVALGEYDRAGLKGFETWPSYPGSVMQGIGLIDSFVQSGDGKVRLLIHPRCQRLIDAFGGYSRAKVRGQWTESPLDPQHPHEDIMDALRGGLMARFPEGRRPERKFSGRVPIRGLI